MPKAATTPTASTEPVEPESSAAAIAARRRRGRVAATAEAPPGSEPAPVDGQTPVTVIASRTLVASISVGEGGLARPVGGVWLGEPLVLPTAPSRYQGVLPHNPRYVIAECDAEETMIPPGCRTATARVLWTRGQLVRRDLYEAVLAAHAAKPDPTAAEPAALPPGITDPPPDALAATAPPADPAA